MRFLHGFPAAGDGKAPAGADEKWEFDFYGVTGQKLAVVGCDANNSPACTISYDTYFGGKRLRVVMDRLGSVRWGNGTSISYFPYGEERTVTADGTEKFGTYVRDGVGQDYAEQRYYNNGTGRFWSPDPNAGSLSSPQSLNRYAYVLGDPINLSDPLGLCPPGMVEADRQSDIDRIISTAESYLNQGLTHADGRHFVTDKTGKLTGIDCSGLVAQAIQGIAYGNPFIEGSKADEFSSNVSSLFSADSSINVGDIVYFPSIGHVVIVTGVSADGSVTFIGSQSSTGPATVNTATNGKYYWAPKLSSARAYKPCVPASWHATGGGGGDPDPTPGDGPALAASGDTPDLFWWANMLVPSASSKITYELVTSTIAYAGQ